MGINIIRFIEERATEPNIGAIIVELPIEIATFLMNEKRSGIVGIEKKQNIKIIIVPNKYINVPNYEIKIIKKEELPKFFKYQEPSYNLINKKEITEYDPTQLTTIAQQTKPAVIAANTTPAPIPTARPFVNSSNIEENNKQAASLIKRVWQMLVGTEKTATPENNDTTSVTKPYKPYKSYNKSRKFVNKKPSNFYKNKKFNKNSNYNNSGNSNNSSNNEYHSSNQANLANTPNTSNTMHKHHSYNDSKHKSNNFKKTNNKPSNHINENSAAYIDNPD
jgi:ribonuclease E